MEEEIEILENYIREWNDTDVAQALENLITRYKEMEADNKRLKDKETEKFLKILDDTSKATLVQETIKLRTQVKDSIPKSKVKDKIEEYKNEIGQLRIEINVTYDSGIYKLELKREALQELLEKE